MRVKNVPLLLATIVYGIVFGVAGNFLYSKLIDNWYKPLVIGLYFLVFSLLLFIIIYKFSKDKQQQFSEHLFRDVSIALAVIFCVSVLFEILYEIGGKPVYNEPTSYIFLIDDSGSMSGNDPENKRIDAISAVMKDKAVDFNYAVYTFDGGFRAVRAMAPKSAGLGNIKPNSNGGTAISATIKGIKHELENGVLNGGAYPRILLLSDGYSTDTIFGTFDIRKELNWFQKQGITVSTVGLGESVDASFMSAIAKKTGGVYINVDNIDGLAEAMKEAMTSYADRDLLSVRPHTKSGWLYAAMRVLFIFIIASCILVGKCLCCGGSDFGVICSVCTGLNLLAALGIEIGLNSLAVPEILIHSIMCVLLAVIVNDYLVKTGIVIGNSGSGHSLRGAYDGETLKNSGTEKKPNVESLR